jgi:prepilin-type N-terminal cleavage/methylation domain-containing protein
MQLAIQKNQRGDTLVEVLIAIMVVSAVLVAGYTTTTHSINTMQDTQEHSEALQLAQTQLEYLHNASKTGRPNGGCFDNAGAPASGNSCLVDSSDNPTSSQPQFKVVISTPDAVSYSVDVTWSSIQAGQTNEVKLYYQP